MYKKILIPLDGSAFAETTILHAEGIVLGSDAELLLVSVTESVHFMHHLDRDTLSEEYMRDGFSNDFIPKPDFSASTSSMYEQVFGRMETEANEVCRRRVASKGETRTMRWMPCSDLRYP